MDYTGNAVPTTWGSLNRECLANILSHLPPASLARCCLLNRHWRESLVQEDSLWRTQCTALYKITSPVGPDQQLQPSFRLACSQWHRLCTRYGDFALRACAAWAQIRGWLDANLPEVAASLRPGASEEELNAAEQQLGVALPPSLRVLYRIHDGQELTFDREIDNQRPSMGPSVFHGLFGGYSFYSHLVSTRMLPVRRLVRWTARLRERLGLPSTDPQVLFAAGFNFNKLVYCKTETADVEISQVSALPGFPPPGPTAAAAAAKAAAAAFYPSLSCAAVPEGVLRWFESYSGALAAGQFGVEVLYPELGAHSKGICLFPRSVPPAVEMITNGVHVAAAPLFIPELSQLEPGREDVLYFFAYSIRFKLLEGAAQAGTGEEAPFGSVQLLDRHWVIRNAAGAVESEVQGDAVVGQYPLLTAGGEEWAYSSCTHQRDPAGSMEGRFTFVENSLRNPGPREVKAACPLFRLDVPSVVF